MATKTFKFWEVNKKDKEFTKTLTALRTAYRKYLNALDLEVVIGVYHYQHVLNFIGGVNGLNSFSEDAEEITEGLYPTMTKYLEDNSEIISKSTSIPAKSE